jgi:hypothetical protein
MAESSLKGLASGVLLLSDRYERKARLAPGLFVVVPIAVYAYTAAASALSWYQSVGLAALVEALLALFAGHLSRALGVAAQGRLFPSGLPTHNWLSAHGPRSIQQRMQWQAALRSLTGIDIYLDEDPAEQQKAIEDAVSQARVRLRGNKKDGLLQTHNEEYGFARNLLGLTPIWLAASLVTVVATGVPLFRGGQDWLIFAIEVVFFVAGVAYAIVGGRYVKWTADRYAESFLAAVVMASEKLAVTLGDAGD